MQSTAFYKAKIPEDGVDCSNGMCLHGAFSLELGQVEGRLHIFYFSYNEISKYTFFAFSWIAQRPSNCFRLACTRFV